MIGVSPLSGSPYTAEEMDSTLRPALLLWGAGQVGEIAPALPILTTNRVPYQLNPRSTNMRLTNHVDLIGRARELAVVTDLLPRQDRAGAPGSRRPIWLGSIPWRVLGERRSKYEPGFTTNSDQRSCRECQ
jgi:hypothetical protein